MGLLAQFFVNLLKLSNKFIDNKICWICHNDLVLLDYKKINHHYYCQTIGGYHCKYMYDKKTGECKLWRIRLSKNLSLEWFRGYPPDNNNTEISFSDKTIEIPYIDIFSYSPEEIKRKIETYAVFV